MTNFCCADKRHTKEADKLLGLSPSVPQIDRCRVLWIFPSRTIDSCLVDFLMFLSYRREKFSIIVLSFAFG